MPRVNDLNQVFNSPTSHIELPSEKLPGNFPILDEDDRTIVRFYSKYRLWMFDYAEIFTKGTKIEKIDPPNLNQIKQDSGFAVLTLLNSYFDVIGQLCGKDSDAIDNMYRKHKPDAKKWRPWDEATEQGQPDANDNKPTPPCRIWYGLTFVFREHHRKHRIYITRRRDWLQVCEIFYLQTRNGIAHIGFPGGILIFGPEENRLPNSYKQPLNWGRYKDKLTIAINWVRWYEHLSNHFYDYILRLRSPITYDDKRLRKMFLSRVNYVK
jgi:hypothetical protein